MSILICCLMVVGFRVGRFGSEGCWFRHLGFQGVGFGVLQVEGEELRFSIVGLWALGFEGLGFLELPFWVLGVAGCRFSV